MRCEQLRFGESFRVAAGTHRSQAATRRESSGGSDGRLPGSDQWLYVLPPSALPQ